MAKPSLFTVYNLEGKRPRKLPSPPTQISAYKLASGAWTGKVVKTKAKKKAKAKKAPKTADEILRVDDEGAVCLHCGEIYDESHASKPTPTTSRTTTTTERVTRSQTARTTTAKAPPNCPGLKCLSAFRKTLLPSSHIQIRGPHPHLGYSAFLSPKSPPIPPKTHIAEYIGALYPPSHSSLYALPIPNTCVIDPQESGNWTRFINSSCEPNLKVWGDFVGGRRVVVLESLRRIEAGEELGFCYGRSWFERAGFGCRCGGGEEHLPGDEGKGKGKGGHRVERAKGKVVKAKHVKAKSTKPTVGRKKK